MSNIINAYCLALSIGAAAAVIAAPALMAKRMNATVTSVDASPVAMLSKPRDVAAVILTAASTSPPTAPK